MSEDDDVDAMAYLVANLPPKNQVDVLLGMVEKVCEERDGWRRENDRHRHLYIEAVKERDELRGAIAERDRLRAVVDAAREWRRWDAPKLDRSAEHQERRHSANLALVTALDQLDVSPTGEDT